MRSSRPAHLSHPSDAFSLTSLEPRTLFSYDTVSGIPEAYHRPEFDQTLAPPAVVPDDDATPFGTTIASVGDLDDDGVADFAVSWPTRANVHVYSAKTQTLLFSVQNARRGFGSTLAGVGDINGDGVPDIAMGAGVTFDSDGSNPDHSGVLDVYSGANGTILLTFTGAPDEELGFSVAGLGDLDGDGHDDLLIGAPGANGGKGYVVGYSGSDGASFFSIDGEAAGDRYGHALFAGVDMPTNVEGTEGLDGKGEFVVGAPGQDAGGTDRGRIYYYASTRAALFSIDGAADSDGFGSGVALVNDHPADAAIIVAAPGVDGSSAQNVGTVSSYNVGKTQIAIRTGDATTAGSSFIGKQIRSLGFITSSQRTVFYTGATGDLGLYQGSALTPVSNADQASLGTPASTAAIGDVDGDGIADLITLAGRTVHLRSSFAATGDLIRGSSDNGRFLWGGVYNQPSYIVTDGVRSAWNDITGLGRATIYSVNNNGDILGAELATEEGAETVGRVFILSNGVKTYIDQATPSGGTPEFDNFIPLEIGNGGHAVFNEQYSQGGFRAWIYNAGTISLLWSGFVYDLNTAGHTTGIRTTTSGNQIVFSDGVTGTTIPEMSDAGVLTDDDVVYGMDGSILVAWTPAGGAVPLYTLPAGAPRILDVDSFGRVLVSTDASTTLANAYVFHRRDTVLVPAGSYNPDTLRDVAIPSLNDAKWIIRSNEIAKPNVAFPIKPDSPLSSVPTPTGLLTVGVHENGHLVMWRQQPFGWKASYLAYEDTSGGTDVITIDAEAYADPRDGFDRVIAITDQGVYWFIKGHVDSPDKLPTLLIAAGADTAFNGRVASFISPDGRVHIVGLNAAGEFLMLYQNGLAAPDSVDNWSVVNLSAEHFDQQGLVTPTFTSNLTEYNAPWGGMNIIGLDETGRLHVVWWAPTMNLWRVDDLTTIAGAPILAGDLTALTTPWGAVTVGAVDPNGQALAIWWAPGNEWRTDVLADANLARGPLTGYTNSWGGLNIVGLDADTGQMVAVWWAPGLAVWNTTPLGGPTGLTLSEIQHVTLTAGTDAADRTSILFRNTKAVPTDERYQAGHLTALSWKPGLVFWAPEDLSLEI